MNQELLEIVEQLFSHTSEPIHQSIWHPLADIYRYEQGWLIKLELAGVRKEDIQINITGAMLKIEGMRRDLCVHDGIEAYRMEIFYNRFERMIELPEKLENAQITLDFNQGMLLIHLSVKE